MTRYVGWIPAECEDQFKLDAKHLRAYFVNWDKNSVWINIDFTDEEQEQELFIKLKWPQLIKSQLQLLNE